MTDLTAAHRGYEYQDLLAACRLVDVLLGSVVSVHVDEKLVVGDRFDDLTTVDTASRRDRTQFKHKDNDDRPLTLATFTTDARSLRLDRLVAAAVADREGPGATASSCTFRVVLRDAGPVDERLLAVLRPASPDPGPFLAGMATFRLRFDADALWRDVEAGADNENTDEPNPFGFLREGDSAVDRAALDWVCERLVVEVEAPAATGDITAPGPAEQLLLSRLRAEVGAESYPNADRSAADVAEAMIRTARVARQGRVVVTAEELLRRTQLRHDFGAVARAHPVDRAVEIPRVRTVDELLEAAGEAASAGNAVLVLGPPGQGKSWACQQLIEELSGLGWLVAEHYCYLGDADGERLARVLAESVFGSLLGRLADADPRVVQEQRPRFAADEQTLVDAVTRALRCQPNRPVALVVDGIDHVTRVRGGGAGFDPSLALAEALGALELPAGSVLIVLSQPGGHLRPLEEAGAVALSVPGLDLDELHQLAGRLAVVPAYGPQARHDRVAPLLTDEAAVDDFLSVLVERSAGNALYATYLCREALRHAATVADPSATLRGLPPFDGTLENYYRHLHEALGYQGGWVADVIALLDFAVTRAELREIRPDAAHRVDDALAVLEPVLVERAAQGGVRVYHESFARFLRTPFQRDQTALVALLDHVARWLKGKGLFKDPRAFRSLLSILAEAGRDQDVVDLVGHDFVGLAVATGFPASAIRDNLVTAIGCAARLGNWPIVVRYVELARATETFQYERFDSTFVEFADVPMALLGKEVVADRLLHDGRPVMSARAGLQMCAAVDELGGVAPWREYMAAYIHEAEKDNTSHGEASDRQVALAWLRGRLRLAAVAEGLTGLDELPEESSAAMVEEIRPEVDAADREFNVAAPVSWDRVARVVEHQHLPAQGVIDAVLDTYGLRTVVVLVARLEQPGRFCLALAERIYDGHVSTTYGSARLWAWAATAHGAPTGSVHRLLALGLSVDDLVHQPIDEARERLLDLTRNVQKSSVRWETGALGEWLDACVIAARKDALGLDAAEALIVGPGWYRCWLRFTMALARVETAPTEDQSRLGLDALRLLTEDLNPFTGDPRSCDLYSIHGVIDATIRRVVDVLDDEAWAHALGTLDDISGSITTTLAGELGGPLPPDRLLRLAVETATPSRRRGAETLVREEIEEGAAGRYYSDLAEYRLLAARLALAAGDFEEAGQLWANACRMLTAYGWHKDITIYELLDPLPDLVAADPVRGRERVAAVQPVCERAAIHTDGRETRTARERWWSLLAAADPAALARLVAPTLFRECNDPNYLLNRARHELWRAWQHKADPIVAGALRQTLEAALDSADPRALARVADLTDGTGHDAPAQLMTLLLARIDERPFRYTYTNSDELLERDAQQVAELNSVAARVRSPQVSPMPPVNEPPRRSGLPDGDRRTPQLSEIVERLRARIWPTFPPGAVGLARAIRAWRTRRDHEPAATWETDRVANIFGYRMIELADGGREEDAAAALWMIADAAGHGDRSGVLAALAQGLDRNDHHRLATIAYTLAWTRARGHGGWLTFGGETEVESLRRAAELDRSLTLATTAQEVERIVSHSRFGTYGISQALIYAFVAAGLGAPNDAALDTAFKAWDEALAVIAERTPRVHPTDDPDEPYTAPDPDDGEPAPGDLDAAFATAALAGLAHPWRENKRRSLLAAKLLLAERPEAACRAFEMALANLSDPATLTWLLRILDRAGDAATPVVNYCEGVLAELAGRPHLTVRALARRLLGHRDDVPMPPPSPADTVLLAGNAEKLWIPKGVAAEQEDAEVRPTDELVESVAGVRLSRAEEILPGLTDAVRERVAVAMADKSHKRRLDKQLDAFADRIERRWPDAYLLSEETVEDALQRAATGGRAARLAAGMPISDPRIWEDKLAHALLDDPSLPLYLEATRQPRPVTPPPPPRGDAIWTAARAIANQASPSKSGVEAAIEHNGLLLATLTISPARSATTVESGPFCGWRILAAVERLTCPSLDRAEEIDHAAKRYRAIEVREADDKQALTAPPVTGGDLRMWFRPLPPGVLLGGLSGSQPIVGTDVDADSVGDGRHGLGIHTPILAPTPSLIASLGLRPGPTPFGLDDDEGPALALVTWRTQYETSDYHLAWPRLCGSAVLIRDDALDRLNDAADSNLILRDFVLGKAELVAEEAQSRA
jgi:hypothetical protein